MVNARSVITELMAILLIDRIGKKKEGCAGGKCWWAPCLDIFLWFVVLGDF